MLFLAIIFFYVLVILKLVKIQILDFGFYSVLASHEHEIYKTLFPKRGEIFLRSQSGELTPLVTNQDLDMVYAAPKYIKDPAFAAKGLSEIISKTEEELMPILSKKDDPYEPLARKLSEEQVRRIQEMDMDGIYFKKENWRYSVHGNLASHVLGFVGFEGDARKGFYGIEGYFDSELSGTPGELFAEKDVAGRWIALTEKKFIPAKDGVDIVLTLDKSIQFVACEKLKKALETYAARSGSVIVMEPKTGRILAMCNMPDFDPNSYQDVSDVGIYNNSSTFSEYEPGSIFKPLTLAAAMDADLITPDTTYEDEGKVHIDVYDIQNSDKLSHGIQTMTQVLEKSLNTGTIFVAQKLGFTAFQKYMENFGFGESTGIELLYEATGNLKSLDKKNSPVYLATASFGQGITVTPLQMVTAFSAIANGGTLMKPYIVDEMRYPDGNVKKIEPKVIRKVISSRTSTLMGGMLVAAVNNGYGKNAAIAGYDIGGKTGTAQVASGGEYRGGTIHSFVGYAPVDDPAFVIITKLDNPQNGAFAESTATPLFREIALFLLQYFQISP
ncbi:MAG: hypothetical protein HY453_01440 [Parcubacteria group bacterium]|nr:hypothetical protein [Parcubacteria group bacterium]